jgi:ribosome-associated protein
VQLIVATHKGEDDAGRTNGFAKALQQGSTEFTMPAPDHPPLPEAALDERFLAATGPGGQNVNKVATAVQLRLDVYALRLAPDVFRRLKALAGSRWTADGGIVVTARRFRTREANRADARTRLAEMVADAHVRPERRIKTKPTRAAKLKRVEAKSRAGAVKRNRARPQVD